MGIFSRFGRVVKANVDDLISQSEDPEKMLNQSLRELAYQMVEIRKKVIVAVADERRFRSQWEAELERARSWKKKAMLAVKAGEDGLAKEALFRRREHEELAEQYQKQWEGQRRGVDQLKVALRGLDSRIREAKQKRGLLMAKLRRAEAQNSINRTLTVLHSSEASERLERLEARINQMEAEADAAWEMNEEMTGDTLKQRFALLEADQRSDLDLLELKEEMGLLPAVMRESDHKELDEKEHEAAVYPIYVDGGASRRTATG